MLKYRAGLPGWKVLARFGWTILVRVEVVKDPEAGLFMACSPDLDGLVVEAPTLDELRTEVIAAVSHLLDMAMDGQQARAKTDIRVSDSVLCAA